MTKHITVGYDGSKSSAEAVEWAAAEAALRGADLRIVACYRIPVGGDAMLGFGYAEAATILEGDTDAAAKQIATTVTARHPNLTVTTYVAPGPAAPALVEDLEEDDLVVVGASSHHGAAAFWLGSTPRRLVRHSPCPVAVVRGPATRGAPRRVVVGVDGSATSDAALDWAGDEAERHHAELIVVHGWSYPYTPVDASSSQAHDLTEVDAACVLDAALEHARERFGARVTGCLIEAAPGTALLQTILDGDLLVVGSRGRGALASGVFGSTVNSVLERCAVPVVVIPQHDRK